eukprot:403364583
MESSKFYHIPNDRSSMQDSQLTSFPNSLVEGQQLNQYNYDQLESNGAYVQKRSSVDTQILFQSECSCRDDGISSITSSEAEEYLKNHYCYCDDVQKQYCSNYNFDALSNSPRSEIDSSTKNLPMPQQVSSYHIACTSDPASKWGKDDLLGFVIFSSLEFITKEGFLQRFKPGYTYVKKVKNLKGVNAKKDTVEIKMKALVKEFFKTEGNINVCIGYFMRKNKEWNFVENIYTNIQQRLSEPLLVEIKIQEQVKVNLLKAIQFWVNGGSQNYKLQE